MKKAVFLDRDGTVNVEKNYLYRKEDFEFLPGVVDSLKKLQDEGFLLIIITNQSGIARGYYTEEEYYALNDWMIKQLKYNGVSIAATYHCPHHPNGKVMQYRMECNCRKPKLGLFERAVQEYGIGLQESYAIGDRMRDISICAHSMCHGFLIGQSEGGETIRKAKRGKSGNVQYALDLKEAADKIVGR